ncbi:hypothetical protein FOA43_003634 [Brettanomyces nanus]|uniref:K Homology domain-containing protein n=1 Tax=Eeniella nana TaxID=13502 RepID=A0A875S5K9_EENNA|nr:uncharacterized protein FOA43_003634 [Brettanomyces nanus]QPG76248.1 hypothetical protein FOA43_003634 [Brettanomyces nanus]
MLKRKSEESEHNTVKRIALDSDAVEQKDIENDKHQTSASLTATDESAENGDLEDMNDAESVKDVNDDNSEILEPENTSVTSGSVGGDIAEKNKDELETSTTPEESKQDLPGQSEEETKTPPISSHRVVYNDDPSYVHFRMLCTISEAATVVGKGGETISKIKEMSNARVNVSENLKGIPERVISVRGPAEYVAKAFGLIVRMLLGEQLNVPSSLESKQYNLRLLFPHTVMGYIIGKRGSRFREIEENSAAMLKANDQILPASSDRVLNINGVADAIHIAAYYIAQTVIEHKPQMSKAIYYNPANFAQPTIPVYNQALRPFPPSQVPQSQPSGQDAHQQMGDYRGPRMAHQQYSSPAQSGYPPIMGVPSQMMGLYGHIPPPPPATSGQQQSSLGESQGGISSDSRGAKPVNMSGGFYQPSYGTTQFNPDTATSNTRTGAVSTGSDGKLNQEVFVPQNHIGLVIGRGGRNLKDIRLQTGCYVKINEEIPGSTERKLTLMGNMYGIQNALLLINNKIENEKLRELRGDSREQHTSHGGNNESNNPSNESSLPQRTFTSQGNQNGTNE